MRRWLVASLVANAVLAALLFYFALWRPLVQQVDGIVRFLNQQQQAQARPANPPP